MALAGTLELAWRVGWRTYEEVRSAYRRVARRFVCLCKSKRRRGFHQSCNPRLLGYSGGAWQNGYPYTVDILGVPGPVQVMCDDYGHGGSIGESWLANITNLGNAGIGPAP